jgi:hypothetical protein
MQLKVIIQQPIICNTSQFTNYSLPEEKKKKPYQLKAH